MLKYLFSIIIISIAVVRVEAQKGDTTILYFKNCIASYKQVSVLDSCDFFRVITPPDDGDNKLNVQEFYKNGKKKFIGKYEYDINAVNSNVLTGYCTSFYLNGKKHSPQFVSSQTANR